MKKPIWAPAIKLILMMTILTGLIYPLAVTGLAGLLFPFQAGGSIIADDSGRHGSALVGQNFSSARYFQGRPSVTGPMPYNAGASGASNLSPRSGDLRSAVKDRAEMLKAANPHAVGSIPADLITASGSGLDPHISRAAALYQVPRVAAVRGIPAEKVTNLVAKLTEAPQFGLLGEERINVLRLNLALDSGKF